MTLKLRALVAPLAFLLTLQCAFAVEYSVLPRNGAPTIAIDGKPTRARFFFGMIGSAPIYATEDYQRFDFEFVAQEDARNLGTFHFRFGRAPGKVEIDNFSIVDEETNVAIAGPYPFESNDEFAQHWEMWHNVFQDATIAEVGVKEGAGADASAALVVKLNPIPGGLAPDFHIFHARNLKIVKGKKYRVRFDARANPPRRIAVNFYRPDSPSYVQLGVCGKDVFASQTKLAADAGVDFVSFIAESRLWPAPNGDINWSNMDKVCDAALDANPNARLVPRINLDPDKAWLDANPEERALWKGAGDDWDGQGWDWESLSSQKYRKVARETLAATIRHLEEKYGDSIAGYHPCARNTSEWFTPNTWTDGYAGFSPLDRDAFRRWLRDKYGNDDALKAAWKDDSVDLDAADVPSVEERDASRLQPIVQSQKLVDFNEFWQKQTTDVILELARVVKEETNRQKLTFFFYGYAYEFSTVRKGPAASAHYALRNLLDSKDVDVVCSPISYSERQLGGGCSCMLNAESVSAAGKLYLYEDDCRTFIANEYGEKLASVESLEESVNILLRNSGETALRNFGTWLMDLGATGWYDSPQLWSASASLAPIDDYFLKNPTPYRPEIALFLGENSMLRVSSGDFTAESVSRLRRVFNRLGAPYAQYDLDDLLEKRVSPPKLSFILNANALDEETRAKIRKLERDDAKIVFVDHKSIDERAARKFAKDANVWIYTDEPCNVWASGPFVLLHAPNDGTFHFRAPNARAKIVDALSGEVYSTDGASQWNLKLGDTKILRLE